MSEACALQYLNSVYELWLTVFPSSPNNYIIPYENFEVFSILIGISYGWWFLPWCVCIYTYAVVMAVKRALTSTNGSDCGGPLLFFILCCFLCARFFFRSLSSNRNKEITMRLNENSKRRWNDATDKRHGLKQVIISAKGNSIKQHILSLLISYECMSVWRYALLKLQSDQTSDGLQHTTTGIQQRRNKNDAFYYCLSHYRLLPST